MTLQSTDLFAVHRSGTTYQAQAQVVKDGILNSHIIQSPTPPTVGTHPGMTNDTIWVDTSKTPATINIWDPTANGGAGGWEESSGGAPRPIAPTPGDTSATPAFAGGTGTQANPFIISPSTVAAAGGATTSTQSITITGKVGGIVRFTDKSTGAGTRFTQADGTVGAGGSWTGKLAYLDTPASTANGTFTGNLQIGSVYFRWVVTQNTIPALVQATATTISGTLSVGQTLTAVPGTATGGTPAITYATRWQRSPNGTTGWNDIAGATGTTHVLVVADSNNYVRAVTTATDSTTPTAQVLELPSASSGVIPASVAPDVGAVTLADAPGASRFTSGVFPVGVTMTQEGIPASTKGLKAYVQGTLTAQPVSDVITALTGTGNPGTAGTPTKVQYRTTQAASTNAQSVVYGKTAQDANNNANHPMFQWAAALNIGGHTDWYIPAKNELEILYRNLKPTTEVNDTSSGTNPNAVPPTGNYTANSPAQTSAFEFQAGRLQAFSQPPYYPWTASENTSTPSLATRTSFADGSNLNSFKNENSGARAIRRIAYTGTEPAIGAAYGGGYFGGLISTAGNGVADYALIVAPNPAGTYGYTGGTPADPYVLTLTTNKDLTVFSAGDAVKQNAATPGSPLVPIFSTTLYTGNSATQTITNGIDLAGEGGLVWCKSRSAAYRHELVDTARGGGNKIETQSTSAQNVGGSDITGFTSSGFTLGNVSGEVNFNGATNVAWTFRKAPKFFDVVTYVGDGTDYRPVSHALGSTPGFIIIKATSATGNWICWHRSLSALSTILLNTTAAQEGDSRIENVSSTAFEVRDYSSGPGSTNTSGVTYVAYLFAHDTDPTGNIQCGSYTGNGSILEIDLGWEAGWVLVKHSGAVTSWAIVDVMRGLTVPDQNKAALFAESNSEEVSSVYYPGYSSRGFSVGATAGGGALNTNGATYIYIAIKKNALGVGIPSGVVASTDATAKTMTLASSSGTWGVNTGNWVVGPKKTLANTRLYCKLDNAAVVQDLQSADPGFVNQLATPTKVTFPALLPSGKAPDVDMPAGTTLTVEVNATNTAGTDSAKSNTITP